MAAGRMSRGVAGRAVAVLLLLGSATPAQALSCQDLRDMCVPRPGRFVPPQVQDLNSRFCEGFLLGIVSGVLADRNLLQSRGATGVPRNFCLTHGNRAQDLLRLYVALLDSQPQLAGLQAADCLVIGLAQQYPCLQPYVPPSAPPQAIPQAGPLPQPQAQDRAEIPPAVLQQYLQRLEQAQPPQ